jgi:hypothetical protein
MPRFWAWIGRHTRALTLGSALAAVVLVVGGIALGVKQTPTPLTAAVGPGGGRAIPVVAQVSASRHFVSGVIVAVGRGRALVRSSNGRYFAIVWTAGAHIRANGREIPGKSLRAGDRVLALGSPTSSGVLRVVYVGVTGHVTLPPGYRPPLPTRPGATPARRTPTPTPE